MYVDVSESEAATRDRLVECLHAAGIHYLGGADVPAPESHDMPAEALLLGLVTSRDARLRTALVALLMRQPHNASVALSLAQRLEDADDARVTRLLRVSILAAAALQRTWAFSLDLYLPGWQPLDAASLAVSLGVPPPEEDYGRATLLALDHLLAGDDPVAPDYFGAWEDVGRHVMADLREEAARHAAC